jgi:hypothetical protein
MDRYPFATLPRELRDEIWVLAQKQDGVINLTCRWISVNGVVQPKAFSSARAPTQSRHPLAVTAVCKQIREETAAVFYVNTLSFNIDAGTETGMYGSCLPYI